MRTLEPINLVAVLLSLSNVVSGFITHKPSNSVGRRLSYIDISRKMSVSSMDPQDTALVLIEYQNEFTSEVRWLDSWKIYIK